MDNFFEFLKGSLNSPNNSSLIKILPKDILYKIWIDYAIDSFDDYELVKKNLIQLKYNNNNNIPSIITSYAIELNNFQLLKWLILEKKVTCSLIPALKNNNIEILNFLIDTVGIKDNLEKIFELSNIQTINYFINKISYLTINYNTLLRNKDLEVIKKFYTKYNTNESDLLYCCEYGNLQLLEWLFLKYPIFCNGYVKNNSFECNISNFKFLVKKGYTIRERNIIFFLNQNMNIDNFKWLKENIPNISFKYRYFIICNDDELRKWLFYNRGNSYSFDEAIQWSCAYDNVKIVKFIYENLNNNEENIIIIEKILYNSIIYGGINVLEYIYNTTKNNYIINSLFLNICLKEAHKKSQYLQGIKKTIDFANKFFI